MSGQTVGETVGVVLCRSEWLPKVFCPRVLEFSLRVYAWGLGDVVPGVSTMTPNDEKLLGGFTDLGPRVNGHKLGV